MAFLHSLWDSLMEINIMIKNVKIVEFSLTCTQKRVGEQAPHRKSWPIALRKNGLNKYQWPLQGQIQIDSTVFKREERSLNT